jgi:glyoxylase-like metal-dependent hydrolase (beta-lactamase superfamily II)
MFRNFLPARLLGLAIVLAAAVGATASPGGTGQRRPAADSEANPLTPSLIRTGLYMISGDTNSLLRLSANGLIVVDGQTSSHYNALRQHLRRISEQPVRLMIATDHHEEHTANNGQFLADGAQILAQEHVAARLIARGMTTPIRTFDDHLNLTLGGVGVRVMHFGNAHTDGDSVVYFPDRRVVAVGDLVADTPSPDYAAGGSLVGWGPVLGEILKLDFDIVVPGRGPTLTKTDLAGWKSRVDTLVARASALVKQGASRDQLVTGLASGDLGWKLAFTPAQADGFYAELARGK